MYNMYVYNKKSQMLTSSVRGSGIQGLNHHSMSKPQSLARKVLILCHANIILIL